MGRIPWRRERLPTPVFLPGESPWIEEPGGLQFRGSQRVRHELAATTHTRGKNHLEGSEGTIQSAHTGLLSSRVKVENHHNSQGLGRILKDSDQKRALVHSVFWPHQAQPIQVM